MNNIVKFVICLFIFTAGLATHRYWFSAEDISTEDSSDDPIKSPTQEYFLEQELPTLSINKPNVTGVSIDRRHIFRLDLIKLIDRSSREFQQIIKRVMAEEFDEKWAANLKSLIEDFILEHPVAQQYHDLDVNCRKKTCIVSGANSKFFDVIDLVAVLKKQYSDQFKGFAVTGEYDTDNKHFMIVMTKQQFRGWIEYYSFADSMAYAKLSL